MAKKKCRKLNISTYLKGFQNICLKLSITFPYWWPLKTNNKQIHKFDPKQNVVSNQSFFGGFTIFYVFSRRATGIHRMAKRFELDSFIRNPFLYMVTPGQTGIIIVTTGKYARCPALKKNLPLHFHWSPSTSFKFNYVFKMFLF